MQILLMGLVLLAIFALIAVRLMRDRIPAEPTTASGESSHPPGARKVADVGAFTIRIEANQQPLLFLLLAVDGTINRMGSGTLEDANRELFIGRSDPAIFEAVRAHLTDAMLQYLGSTFQSADQRGSPCKLTLAFQFKDATSNGIAFLYGSESEGMPPDIAEFVKAAVRQTDPWYEDFKRNAAARKQP